MRVEKSRKGKSEKCFGLKMAPLMKSGVRVRMAGQQGEAAGVKMFVSLTLTGGDFEKTTEFVRISVCRWRAGERHREGGRETGAERR